jgi:hypothetical protein
MLRCISCEIKIRISRHIIKNINTILLDLNVLLLKLIKHNNMLIIILENFVRLK